MTDVSSGWFIQKVGIVSAIISNKTFSDSLRVQLFNTNFKKVDNQATENVQIRQIRPTNMKELKGSPIGRQAKT